MVRTTVYLEEEALQGLKALARRTGKSEAALMREAVSRLLEGMPRPRMRSMGAGEGPGDLAARAEELLDAGFGEEGGRRGRRR